MFAAIAALLAQAISSYSKGRQARAQKEEMDRRHQDEEERQKGFQAQADQRVRDTIQEVQPERQQQNLGEAVARRTDAYQPVIGSQPQYTPHTASAPVEVKDDLGRQVAQALAGVQSRGAARARLQAFGDANQDTDIALGRAGQDLRQIGGASRGSAAILPAEMEGAMNKGGNWGNAGGWAGLISKGLQAYAMGGAGAGAIGAAEGAAGPMGNRSTGELFRNLYPRRNPYDVYGAGP